MSILTSSDLEELEKNCTLILENNKIKFVGVINALGNLVAGGFGKGMMPPGFEDLQKTMFMQLKLDLNMRQEYDGLFGPVSYVISRRSTAVKISLPVESYMVLIITEPNFDYDSKIEEIASIFKSCLSNYV